MHRKISFAGLSFLAGLISSSCVCAIASANTVFTNAELAVLQDQCSSNPSAPYITNSKKSLLLYHKDGYVPAIHFALPDNTRADSLDSAAAILCLDYAPEEIEVCNFNIFFKVARIRQRYSVTAVSLDESSNSEASLYINGDEPVACDQMSDLDNTVTSVTGNAVSADDLMDFLTNSSLDRQDNDRDGLRNIEEFKIGTDPDDSASPAANAKLFVNGKTNARLFQGEDAEIRVDLFPAQFIGNSARYYFWADFPDGRYVFQYPAGLIKTNILDSALSAPLVRLLDFRLIRIKNLTPGDYKFYFEARDDDRSINQAIATLTVTEDLCRQEISLPLKTDIYWDDSCKSSYKSGATAAYLSFSATQQSIFGLQLTSNSDAMVILRAGEGRNGNILNISESTDGLENINVSLDAGDYTLEIINEEATSNDSFSIKTNNDPVPWRFTDVSESAGINNVHGYLESDVDNTDPSYERILQGGGVAAGDYNQDGWTDLYVTSGSSGNNFLYKNNGDGTFTDVAEEARVNFYGRKDAGATFADINGDGWPDLFLGGVNGTPPLMLLNNQDGTFIDHTDKSGFKDIINPYSASFADFDKDGDVDAYISHWNTADQGKYLFENNGTGIFSDISTRAGIRNGLMADYTPIFTDINNDSWLDLLIAADFNTSQVYLNNRDGTFSNITNTDVITDDNGMGAAVGDYDNDGDMDWFVSSIFDPNGIPNDTVPGANTGPNGNRLYRNDGLGEFEDVTEYSGVRIGGWGWGSCFADLNNDGWLDLFHVNGYVTNNFTNNALFLRDGSNLFINNKDGTFSTRQAELSLIDTNQGRGISCLDYDLDGDVDLFVSNNQQNPRLYRNDGGNDFNFLHVHLGGDDKNLDGIGARVIVSAGGITQTREIYAGNNYISNNPPVAYFGLGDNKRADELIIKWPDNSEQKFKNVSANQIITVFKN